MQKKKALFFDIDGTIWNAANEIPDSTVTAIQTARKNGHRVLINTGRCRAFIQSPKILSIGFDGMISGCGTMIEYEGKTIFYRKLEMELLEHTIRTVRRYGFRPILEGREFLYMDEEEFAQDPFGAKLKEEMGEQLLSISAAWGNWEASKLSCAMDGADIPACFSALDGDYTYMVHNEKVVEMVPKGLDKGTGLTRICSLLQTDPEDTIVFGDSANDLAMFRAAGVAVCMGNGSKEAKAAADYVTAPLEEDGIWKACRQLGVL